jgi:RNA polymerase sigma-70 factor (ECF subfamily)
MENSQESVCNESVFQKLFEAHAKDLYKFLYYKYGADNNPQDLVQEAFVKLWNNCGNVLFEKARAFLFTVANNQMLNELAKKATHLSFSKQPQKHYTNESPEFVLEETEYKERLERALAELSPEQRTTLMLNRVEGKKHKEIAEMLGISQKAVEKRIYSALSILREKIGDI